MEGKVLLPFYRVSNFCVDAYMLDKLSEPLERILMVKSLKSTERRGKLEPLSFEEVRRLMREAYDLLKSENVERRRITTLEATVYPMLNPSLYMKSREEEVVYFTTLRLYHKLYSKVLEEMEGGLGGCGGGRSAWWGKRST